MKLKIYSCVLMIVIVIVACKKSPVEQIDGTANINLINAMASFDSDVKVNFSGKDGIYNEIHPIGYYNTEGWYTNGAVSYAILSGRPVNLVVVKGQDSTSVVFSQTVNLKKGSSSSLFIVGTADNPEGVLIGDHLPARTAGTIGIRFINLSPDSPRISVNLEGKSQNLIDGLPYKSYSEFIPIQIKPEDEYFMLEFRNAETGDIITSYFYDNLPRMNNETIIIRGLVAGGDGPQFEATRMRH